MELPAHPELTPAWREICAELRRLVGDSVFELWLSPLTPRSWDGHVLSLEAPRDTASWVPKRFGEPLQRSVRKVLGSDARAEVSGPWAHSARERPSSDSLQREQAFNPRHSFDQFVIGQENRLAHAAALATAEYPGQAYNPLFIHATPGLGKTHLLHAIGNYVLAFGGGAVVRYTTAETFTNHFMTALHSRSTAQFKQAYRDVDILLIDDVQFLASKAKTEEEFFHTFNAIHESGRQLVLTCDRVPAQLDTFTDRLRERFEAGLVAEIRPPDFSTRLTILRKRTALDQIELAEPGVLELIAARIVSNVRALEGALIRVVAYHSLTGQPIDTELAATVLDTICPPARPSAPPSPERIKRAVAEHFGLSVDELVSESRANRVAWPRQIAIFLTREMTGTALQEVGGSFGGRNHATVLHACKRVSARVNSDQRAAADVRELTWALKSEHADRSC